MEYLVLTDHLEGKSMHLPSTGYPKLPLTNDCEGFTILDDDDEIYFTGFIYNSKSAGGSDFNEILEFMEYYGATKLIVNGEVILG